MNALRFVFVATLLWSIAACTQEAPPPRTVDEFVNSAFLLEAAMVRCSLERSKTKYDIECINAREAANRLAIVDREARHKDLEAQSERKRKALRRTQQAATEARRRAAEQRRLRDEAEYLGLYEAAPDDDGSAIAITHDVVSTGPLENEEVLPGNQPGAAISLPQGEENVDAEAEPPSEPADIGSIRDELKLRQDSSS